MNTYRIWPDGDRHMAVTVQAASEQAAAELGADGFDCGAESIVVQRVQS